MQNQGDSGKIMELELTINGKKQLWKWDYEEYKKYCEWKQKAEKEANKYWYGGL